jgi:hypothetical protein
MRVEECYSESLSVPEAIVYTRSIKPAPNLNYPSHQKPKLVVVPLAEPNVLGLERNPFRVDSVHVAICCSKYVINIMVQVKKTYHLEIQLRKPQQSPE